MDWANTNFAPGKEAQPSRLIVEVKNPTDTAISDYFRQKHYETEGDGLDAGKTTYFLRLITGIVMGVGLFISILSFYILMLSIFLLLQKNTVKLENLLLIGYTPKRIALPYNILTASLNLLVLALSVGGVSMAAQLLYRDHQYTISANRDRNTTSMLDSGMRFVPCCFFTEYHTDTQKNRKHLER